VQRFSVLCSPILSCKKSLFVGSIGEFLICLSAPIVGTGELSGESLQVFMVKLKVMSALMSLILV
jgi:hypothetical protein